METLIINENDVGYVKIFKDEVKDFADFRDYKNLPNAVVEREGTADEYVVFKTFDLSKAKTTVWLLEQYDIWFSSDSRRIHGVFSSREKALEAVGYGTDGWNRDYYENGTNQWKSDALECGIMVSEVELDEFGEV
jgi:hypothetical protein